MDKKKLVKIIVPVCIVLIIAGIWILKNIYRFNSANVFACNIVTIVP